MTYDRETPTLNRVAAVLTNDYETLHEVVVAWPTYGVRGAEGPDAREYVRLMRFGNEYELTRGYRGTATRSDQVFEQHTRWYAGSNARDRAEAAWLECANDLHDAYAEFEAEQEARRLANEAESDAAWA